MKYTNDENIYFIDSFGPNCWRHIWAARLSDWNKPNMMAWQINSDGWITDDEAETALAAIAIANGWKEI